MSTLSLIIKEIGHRKWNFVLSLIAVITAVALFVSFFTTGEASKRETTRLMRDMGYNLRIIHKDTDMDAFWVRGYSDITMPEEYVQTMATAEIDNFLFTHLLATLQERIDWKGHQVILKGIAPEVMPVGKKKPPMIFSIQPGTIYVGYELVRSLGLEEGDEVELLGQSFTIERCLYESGTEDDIRIYAHLDDVQALLNQEGEINEIQALDCKCFLDDYDPLTILREQLDHVLPNTKVFQIRNIAEARIEQRDVVEGYFAFILPLVVLVCAVWIASLAMMNVRERQGEIGVLRALGYGSGKITAIFLGKSVFVGVVGAILGYLIGTVLALQVGPQIFKVTADKISPIHFLFIVSLIAAPLFAALSSFIPTMLAVTQDPADVLREE